MPVPVPQFGTFNYVQETKVSRAPALALNQNKRSRHFQEELDWADLVTVDLSKLDTPEGKKEQADILINAVRDKGFFYVKGFGISQDRVDRQFSLGKQFYELPLEEQKKYTPDGLGMFQS
jgi:hypothetical protein